MEGINEIKIPKGVDRIAVKQYGDKIVFEFIPEDGRFKRGDILIYKYPESDETGIVILSRIESNKLYHIAILNRGDRLFFNHFIEHGFKIIGFADNEHKTKLFEKLKKEGKVWNAEKLEIEDMPQPKFKVGDSVMIKEGISSKTHRYTSCVFLEDMDKYIGKKLIVRHAFDNVHYGAQYRMTNDAYCYAEDWLEPYTEELKKGDLAIFWDNGYNENTLIHMYDRKGLNGYYDSSGRFWRNAIKFESKEQFEKILNGKV